MAAKAPLAGGLSPKKQEKIGDRDPRRQYIALAAGEVGSTEVIAIQKKAFPSLGGAIW